MSSLFGKLHYDRIVLPFHQLCVHAIVIRCLISSLLPSLPPPPSSIPPPPSSIPSPPPSPIATDYTDAPFDEIGTEEGSLTMLSPKPHYMRRGSVSTMYDVLPEELGRYSCRNQMDTFTLCTVLHTDNSTQ